MMPDKRPLVAVAVPVYNQKREYLDECIASVLSQTYADWELYLVDDGSDGKTAQYLDDIAKKDGRIKVHHQKNAGISAARKKSTEITKNSDYFTFLDSDDVLEPDMISRCVNEAERTGADFVITTHTRLGDGGRVSDDYIGPKEFVFENETIPEFSRLCLCSRGRVIKSFPYSLCVWGKLIRTEFLRQNPDIAFDPTMRYAEDLLYCLRMAKRAKKIALIDENLYAYRVNDSSTIRSLRRDFLEGNMHAFDIIGKEIDPQDSDICEAFDNFRIGHLVIYATAVLYHPKSELTYRQKRQLLKKAVGLSHFKDTLFRARREYFRMGQYIYLVFLRCRFYDLALLAAWYGAALKWKGHR